MNIQKQRPMYGATALGLMRPVQTDAQLSHPLETCTQCGWKFRDYPFRTCRECRVVCVIDINACDPGTQFDRTRDLDERGITARDAYAEEHPRQSGGERV